MLILLVTSAFAGVLWEEDQLQEECIEPGTCVYVVGEVVDAGCRSTSQDESGAIHRQFRADIRVLEGTDELPEGTVFALHTASTDYTYVDDDYGVGGCTLYDPGHPVGEIAGYYLAIESTDGVHSLFGSETFFHTDDSDPDPEPLCAELEADWDFSDDDDSSDDDGSSSDEASSSSSAKEGGCSSAAVSSQGWMWMTGLLGLLVRRRTA